MDRLTLEPHPSAGPTAARRIEAEIHRTAAGRLEILFDVTGDINAILLPARAAPVRRDGLWKTTCFEAFLRAPRARGYFEFNFSPSTEWAAYRFRAYREDMTAIDLPAPSIVARSSARRFHLRASIDLPAIRDAARLTAFSAGLTAVIEEKDGEKSYWALAHPPGKPDFHHRDGFTHVVTREEQI